jgi:thioredoxin 1
MERTIGKEMSRTFEDIIFEGAVLVDFTATWCGPCKMLAPRLKELKDLHQEAIKIVKIDVDKNQALSQEMNIQGVPTLIFYKDGKQIWRESGVMSTHELNEKVKSYL